VESLYGFSLGLALLTLRFVSGMTATVGDSLCTAIDKAEARWPGEQPPLFAGEPTPIKLADLNRAPLLIAAKC
jgi:hypothetical protein